MAPVTPPGPPRHPIGGYREYAPPPHLQSAPLLGLEPGEHGDAERDLAGVNPLLLAELLEPLAETRAPDQAASLLAELLPAWTDEEHDEDWDYIVRTVIERAWRGARGQG